MVCYPSVHVEVERHGMAVQACGCGREVEVSGSALPGVKRLALQGASLQRWAWGEAWGAQPTHLSLKGLPLAAPAILWQACPSRTGPCSWPHCRRTSPLPCARAGGGVILRPPCVVACVHLALASES